jgi:hypothetical protein
MISTLLSFLSFMLKMGLVEAVLKPISIQFTVYSIKEYLPGVYEKLDKRGFIEKIAGGDNSAVQSEIESAFASVANRLPSSAELAAVVARWSPVVAAARIATEPRPGQAGERV